MGTSHVFQLPGLERSRGDNSGSILINLISSSQVNNGKMGIQSVIWHAVRNIKKDLVYFLTTLDHLR